MEFCKVTLTFESADEILWCDHSNESSLPVLTHGAILENEICKFGGNLPLATFGSERVKSLRLTKAAETWLQKNPGLLHNYPIVFRPFSSC